MHTNFATLLDHFLQISDYLLNFVEKFIISDILDYPSFEEYSMLFAERLHSTTADRTSFLLALQV
jgi:hypothetical protein